MLPASRPLNQSFSHPLTNDRPRHVGHADSALRPVLHFDLKLPATALCAVAAYGSSFARPHRPPSTQNPFSPTGALAQPQASWVCPVRQRRRTFAQQGHGPYRGCFRQPFNHLLYTCYLPASPCCGPVSSQRMGRCTVSFPVRSSSLSRAQRVIPALPRLWEPLLAARPSCPQYPRDDYPRPHRAIPLTK